MANKQAVARHMPAADPHVAYAGRSFSEKYRRLQYRMSKSHAKISMLFQASPGRLIFSQKTSIVKCHHYRLHREHDIWKFDIHEIIMTVKRPVGNIFRHIFSCISKQPLFNTAYSMPFRLHASKIIRLRPLHAFTEHFVPARFHCTRRTWPP